MWVRYEYDASLPGTMFVMKLRFGIPKRGEPYETGSRPYDRVGTVFQLLFDSSVMKNEGVS